MGNFAGQLCSNFSCNFVNVNLCSKINKMYATCIFRTFLYAQKCICSASQGSDLTSLGSFQHFPNFLADEEGTHCSPLQQPYSLDQSIFPNTQFLATSVNSDVQCIFL